MRYRFLRFPEGKYKAVTFSYDDGCRGDIRLAETLSRFGLKGTFNINSRFIADTSDGHYLTAEEIQEYILNRGHEIALHGAFHRAPGKQRALDGIQDVLTCRLELEKRFKRIVRGMAYPDTGIHVFTNGASYEQIKQYLTDLEVAYSRTVIPDNQEFMLPTDWHAWAPTAHHEHPELFTYIDEFVQTIPIPNFGKHTPKLFYLWGHSYEFERNQNWERLEQICEKLSGHEDCWYATNIEIYDYVKAYESLVFSADSRLVYNPSLMQVWFEVDGVVYTVKSGETVELDV